MSKEIGYKFCQKSHVQKQNNFNYYVAAYETLINEWANDFFTPYSLLKQIQKDFSYVMKNTIILKSYDLNHIKKIISDDYKYYKEFFKYLNNASNFSIRVCLFSLEQINNVQIELDKIYRANDVDKMLDVFIKDNAPSQNFNDHTLSRGCLIFIDIDKINIYDEYEFERTLDHELNHYFQQLDPIQYNVNKSAISIILKYAKICEYDFNGFDFIEHMFSDEEFIPMCSNVCNCLEQHNISYYDWLNLITSKYISSEEFLKLDIDLQNNLFFSFCCRVVSPARWNRLKQAVLAQFHSKPLNIFKNIKHFFIDKKLQKH